jgi:glucan phosphoethanolaminetransferase (alkaline phosphatase superfamily)
VVTLSLVDLRSTADDLRSEIGGLVVTIFVAATLLLALRASGVAKRYRIVGDVLLLIGLVGSTLLLVLNLSTDSDVAMFRTPPVAWLVFSGVASILVIRRLLRHDRASARTLLGAVSAYLLIALAFNFVFLTVDASQSTPFFGTEEPTTSFMYFSLVTVTTLGYGDLSAVEPFGRLPTTVGAVIGQVYLVTFVAMIVGLIVNQRQRSSER